MQKRNVWIATGSLSVMALGLGVAVADSTHNPRDLGSSINRTTDDVDIRDEAPNGNRVNDDGGSADRDGATESPTPEPRSAEPSAPTATSAPSAPTAASAPSAPTPAEPAPAPAPVVVPAPAPVPPPNVSADSGYSAPSSVSAPSASSGG